MASSLQISADSSFSSSFLQKLTSLVQSIHPDSFQVKLGPADKQSPSTFRSCTFSQGVSLASTRSNASRPKPPVVPRLSLEVCRNELDEQSEALDKEIEAVMEAWEQWITSGALDSVTGRLRTWDRGHPLDLNDEFIHEDPNYDEEQVDREALEEYLKEQGLPAAAPGKSAGRNRNALATSESDGGAAELQKPSTSTRGRPRGRGQRKPAVPPKPGVALGRMRAPCQPPGASDKSGSSSSDSPSEEEEEEYISPPRKRRALGSVTSRGQRKKGQAFSADPSSRLGFAKQKGLRGNPGARGQSAPDGSGDSSGTSHSPSGRRYSLRRQNGTLGNASRNEDGGDSDGLSSEADSEDEWCPDSEVSALGEEEEEDEGEEEVEGNGNGEEEVGQTAAGTGPVRRTSTPGGRKVATRSYPCPDCARVFSNSSNMHKHLRIHRREFPFPCHACGKSYSDPSNLAKHQLTHGGERPHACSHCPKAFFQKGQLDAHLRRHQGIRPFACLDCPSRFYSRADLTMHIRIHAVGRGQHRPRPLLRCTDCDKTFAGTRLLRQHKQRHRSFPCEVCGLVFTLKFKCLFHMRTHEGYGQSRDGGNRAAPGIAARQSVAGSGRCTKIQGSTQATGRASSAGKPSSEGTKSLTLISSTSSASAGTTIRSKPPSAKVSARSPPVGSTARPQEPSSSQTAGRPLSPGRSLVQAGPRLTTPAGGKSPDVPRRPSQARPVATSDALGLPNGAAVVPHGSTQAVYIKWVSPVALVTTEGTVVSLLPPLAGDGTAARIIRMDGPLQNTVSVTGQSAEAVPVQLVPIRAVQPATAPAGSVLVRLPPDASTAFPAASSSPGQSAGSLQGQPGSALPSGSNPTGRLTNSSAAVRNPTRPPGAELSAVPGQRIVPVLSPKTCPLCHVKYLGKHHCKASRPTSASRTGAEGREVICLDAGGAQVERETVRRSARQGRAKVVYVDQGDGDESDLGGASEDDWQPDKSTEEEEEEPPVASAKMVRLRFPAREPRSSRRSRPRRDRYMCHVCDKRFVHQRSLKQHMRLHFAFSCTRCAASFLRSEQLRWHMLSHGKGVAT